MSLFFVDGCGNILLRFKGEIKEMKNYYEILEVDKHATSKVIKGVYKLHIKENHPDLFQGEEKLKAEERLKKLNEAYEVLSDETKRRDYDKLLESEYESELTLLKAENEELKSMLVKEKQYADDLEDIELYHNPQTESQSQYTEYEPDESATYENNKKYMKSLLQKEFVIKLIMTICVIIAASIGLYRATGFNLFEFFWKFLTTFFN